MNISEKAFENSIEESLTNPVPQTGSDTRFKETDVPYNIPHSKGYIKRQPEDYDRTLGIIAEDAINFIRATQPQDWQKFCDQHREQAKNQFAKLLSRDLDKYGALKVLRSGLRSYGCKFQMAYYKPSSGLNEDTRRLYLANQFSIVRQLKYSLKNENCLDMVLFLNGIPIITAELKNPLTGQNVKHAIQQYQNDRDPKELLFAFRRCLAHFAIDPDLVYVTTKLEGKRTRFLPFNRGKFGGAGNPPAMQGFATSYLWDEIWTRDSVLNLVQQFITEIEMEDEDGRLTGEKSIIFPRYHQLDCVRRLVDHARQHGPGHRYLIQHSAGSGKSNSIAWLAHQLAVLHDEADQRVFNTIVVITDRRVLDRQLQSTMRQFEQTLGVVENITSTAQQLKKALEEGKNIIVSTLQKYPVIADDMKEMDGHRFAVIIDEAHSSQTGEATKSLKKVLSSPTSEDNEQEDEVEAADVQDRIVAEIKARGRQPNVSFFAFTATPKPKTLELFGAKQPDGSFEPFSLYSMRQAIEEGFILDVLENYTTYKTYWKLLKKIKDDPKFDRNKASSLLKRFVEGHPDAIRQKLEIMVEHFHENVAYRIQNKAKAMIVTRSRANAVQYKLTIDQYFQEMGYPYKALVAFSGSIPLDGKEYTEGNMNSISETQTARTFKSLEYRFMIVAEKFQTGFDQPLLHTMYVDKRISGVNAVQTLSRLNRICPPDKHETMILDFCNEADDIQKAFQPYYEKTILSESTDPQLLYDLYRRILDFHLISEMDLQKFAQIYFVPNAKLNKLYHFLAPFSDRFKLLITEEQTDLRGQLQDYVRLYSFLSQIITFVDADLEKMYVFARLLLRYLPPLKDELPREIQGMVDMATYRVKKGKSVAIKLKQEQSVLNPEDEEKSHKPLDEDIEPLSQIIKQLNERFGTNFTDKDTIIFQQLKQEFVENPVIHASLKANTPENARLTFDNVVKERMQEFVESNFNLYKRFTDDRNFARYLLDWLFDKVRTDVG
ncbi:MAG TPA: type I restriction endonuclease [bacterium]|nr:type I restriction endonuclease [bacterium]HPN44854.1 type I restriction endonuclease [bacterium]